MLILDGRRTRMLGRSLLAGACVLVAAAGSALADVPTAKLTTRGGSTGGHTNRISVKTGDQEEIATTNTISGDTEEQRMQDRAGAINSQMTRCTATASQGVGANVLTITALNGRKITGIDHNGLDGEEINVNPQSLLYTNSNLHVFNGTGESGAYLALNYPQLGVHAQVSIFQGMTGQQMCSQLLQQLMAQGVGCHLIADGIAIDPLLIGGQALDPYSMGVNFRYTGRGFNLDIEHFWMTGPGCGSPDFDGDGDVGTDADIEAFFACLGGNCCQTCGSADFDGDDDVGTDADIEAFFRVLAGGGC